MRSPALPARRPTAARRKWKEAKWEEWVGGGYGGSRQQREKTVKTKTQQDRRGGRNHLNPGTAPTGLSRTLAGERGPSPLPSALEVSLSDHRSDTSTPVL